MDTKTYSERRNKKWEMMPVVEWDTSLPVFDYGGDECFFDTDQIDDYCEEHEINPSSLRLVIGKPDYLTEIDPYEYYEDILPEGGNGEPAALPKEIVEAFAALNDVISARQTAISYSEGYGKIKLEEVK